MPFVSIRNVWSQFFPPPPAFTEENVLSQKGRVFIVTGGNTGIGFELCKMLYGTGATIYMASRTQAKAEAAIEAITTSSPSPDNPGEFKFLHLDLSDLRSVKRAATTFAELESKLDVLWNNAGAGANLVQIGDRTEQGLEPMMGIHCVATLLFSELLLPQLRASTASGGSGSARVVWTSSYLAEGATPKNGIDFNHLETGTPDRTQNYGISKAGTWMLGREFGRRYGKDGIMSVVQNPGNCKAGTYGGTSAVAMLFVNPLLHEVKLGAYTELYAGLSPELSQDANNAYVIPWGRVRAEETCPRKDIIYAMTPTEQGGQGYGTKLWEWCEQQWKPFV
ncbi:hypothetical protein N7462_005361 [Penicillium macrosclerotiorum]|uniref:uncharacterized protein n=1 Tax=Penicillium macrosclerotiorum TaxID=303699 RepID=UPI0025493A69|nr:uncharacterized protein N7462_005361 [Penicillium macrosclerotiorum]KAJ5682196.1 hypothetical protein N7462_005361 [Penicillium macrosclerotiorum]